MTLYGVLFFCDGLLCTNNRPVLSHPMSTITIGVLALQGAFHEHLQLLRKAAARLSHQDPQKWNFVEVRTASQLKSCAALIIPGGESTTMSLVAGRSELLEPLRDFVKYGLRMMRHIIWVDFFCCVAGSC